ncbi:hypothetical protein GCM10009789_40670 [Kribbella sancticallisti]|uniref:RCK N-terminal domain-containing protein n=1 Tax=Kribbella sancticallisti TaxID=460087 RepID=A0ABP4PJ36_9ACTN
MTFVRALLRAAHRLLTDDNFDLWLLTAAAAVFTVLGIVDVADMSVLSSAILALLAALAVAQIRSRKLVAQLAIDGSKSAGVLLRQFPEDLISRRAEADDMLLIGIAMARTIQGARDDLYRALMRGARIRVLVVDPTDDRLVEQASMLRPAGRTALLARRIRTTLDELVELKGSTNGNLEIRVARFVPPIGVSLLRGVRPASITVQHPELRPASEPGPILHFEESDSWFAFYAQEAERLWEAGTAWPLPSTQQLRSIARPQFTDSFGTTLITSMKAASDLFITGITRNTLLNSNYLEFERLLAAGCHLRVLLIAPDSAAARGAAERYYAERSEESTVTRIEHSLRLLTQLATSTGASLEVRLTTYLLSSGIVAVDIPDDHRHESSGLFVEYYTFQADGEPKFVLLPGDAGFDQFLGEAEKLWADATPFLPVAKS